jgi:prepilin-type N-terminal cleavage/methylation domain-containing protein
MKRRGFTIVELLMVVGILAVLMTIVTTSAVGALKQARARRAEALVAMVQAGIETYHAQNDEWPGFDGDGRSGSSNDPDRYVLTDTECDDVMRELVRKSVSSSANPLLDVTGLFVARLGTVTDKTYGMDFMEAVKGTKRSPDKLKIAQMMFGYPNQDNGRFKRFKMTYSIPADQLTVSK